MAGTENAIQLIGEPTCQVLARPGSWDHRHIRGPLDRIFIELRSTFALPPPANNTLSATYQHTFVAPLHRVARNREWAHNIAGQMLAVVLAPPVPSLVDLMLLTFRRMDAGRDEWDPWVSFHVSMVAVDLPRHPPEREGLTVYDLNLHFPIPYLPVPHVSGHLSNPNPNPNPSVGEGTGGSDSDRRSREILATLLGAGSGSFTAASEDQSVKRMEKTTIKVNDVLKMCAICLENIRVGSEECRLPCSHGFHKDCIAKWLRQRNNCPMCRSKLLG